MRLAGRNGHRLELTLLGYQFPTTEDDEWDSNWLNIRISAANDRGSWNATDASLTTGEVASLADWLDAIAGRGGARQELDFIEPDLSFELVEANDSALLRAWFELELRPRWARWDEVPARDLCVDLDIAGNDLRAAAESLREQLRRFPPRAQHLTTTRPQTSRRAPG
jgi:hypothetical protein